jgi:hypothetical protein
MGWEQTIAGAERLTFAEVRAIAAGLGGMVAMIDGQLVMPAAPPPPSWRDVRFRFGAGMVTVSRRPGALALVVFGNADPALQEVVARFQTALAERSRPGD